MATNVIAIRDRSLRKLIERCQEKERMGWECVKPIKKEHNRYKDIIKVNGRREYIGDQDDWFYITHYRREAGAYKNEEQAKRSR